MNYEMVLFCFKFTVASENVPYKIKIKLGTIYKMKLLPTETHRNFTKPFHSQISQLRGTYTLHLSTDYTTSPQTTPLHRLIKFETKPCFLYNNQRSYQNGYFQVPTTPTREVMRILAQNGRKLRKSRGASSRI